MVVQNRAPRVLLAGDVMADIIVRPEGALRKGSDTKAQIEIKPGGSAANQAVWLAASGIETRLIARVALADRERLVAEYLAKGVNAILAGDRSQATGALISLVEADGERSFFTDRGANENLCLGDVPEGAVQSADLLLLSGYSFFSSTPRKLARELMAEAKFQAIPVAIDPSSAGFLSDVGPKNFLRWTKGADILFPNAAEAAVLTGKSAVLDQIEVLAENYGLVVVKRGAEGACAGSTGSAGSAGGIGSAGSAGGIGSTGGAGLVPVCVEAKAAKVVDTTGAGDAFAAGFLAAYLRGKSLADSLGEGAITGAKAVSQPGGQPGP